MAFNVSYVYLLKDKYSAAANKIKAKNAGVSKSFVNLQKRIGETSKKLVDLGKNLSLKVTAPIVAAGTAAAVMFGNFEEGLGNTLTLLDSSAPVKYAKNLAQVAKSAIKAGFSTADSTKALFDSVSALGAGKAALDAFGVGQKLAIGGAASLSISVDGLTSIVNAYGKETTKATDVANAFFSAQKGGKCFAKGTEILMHEGTSKKVEDIIVGDMIMGDDNKPRNILALGSGQEMMYKIILKDGSSYVVNESHILSLKRNPHQRIDIYKGKKSIKDIEEKVVNLTVKEYLEKSQHFKTRYLAYKVGVEFEDRKIDIDPYLLGMWLGDGHSGAPRITTMDKEVVAYMKTMAIENAWNIKKYEQENNKSSTYSLTKDRKEQGRGSLWSALGKYNLQNNKHIPKEYMINSSQKRLELLAGLIDSDGHLSINNKRKSYEFSNKNKMLVDNFVWVARSCGFYASVREKTINNAIYYIVYLSGDLWNIPCKIQRKKCNKPQHKKRNHLTQGFKVEKLQIDTFYGFEIDGNRLFVLNDFSVTHNTTVAALASNVGKVAPSAKAAGIGFKTLLATMAQLTLGGLSTEMATTGLRGAINSLVKPSKEAEKILMRYGIASNATELQSQGLVNTLSKLSVLAKKNPNLIAQMIPEVEARTAIAALGEKEIGNLRGIIANINKDIANGTGLTEAYTKKNIEFNRSMSKMGGSIKIAAIAMGAVMAPVIKQIAGFIASATDKFVKFSEAHPKITKLALVVAGLAAVLGPIAVMAGLAGAAFAVISVPVLLIAAQIALVGVAIASVIAFWKELTQIGNETIDFWSNLFGGGSSDININGTTPPAGGGVAARTLTNNARIDGNINVNAAPGTVSSVQSNMTGANIGGLGLNMAGAGG